MKIDPTKSMGECPRCGCETFAVMNEDAAECDRDAERPRCIPEPLTLRDSVAMAYALAGGTDDQEGHRLAERLGIAQPDGEPCTPMSARAWRWLP